MIYYSVIIAWALRFVVASFTDHLPWEDCTSCDCLLYSVNVTDLDLDDYRDNNTYGLNCMSRIVELKHLLSDSISQAGTGPTEGDEVLGKTSGIDEPGDLQWEILVANLVAYVIVCLVLAKGIKSLGKVAYFTATFPYILLTVLLVRGVMLDGSSNGIKYYLEPDWGRLSDASVSGIISVKIYLISITSMAE
nr:hypothetical protein BaRGS_024722 [Batillaria attramentaria]